MGIMDVVEGDMVDKARHHHKVGEKVIINRAINFTSTTQNWPIGSTGVIEKYIGEVWAVSIDGKPAIWVTTADLTPIKK